MSPARIVLLGAVYCLGPTAASAAAQTQLTLELGGSQVGPAADFDSEDARFAMGGLRASVYGPQGSGVYASFLGGQVLGDSVGGSFFSGIVEANLRDHWSNRWTGNMDFKLFGFGVKDPFPYRTLAAEVAPSVQYRTPVVSLKAGVVGGMGRSRVELWRRVGGPTRVFSDDLWRLGANAEFLVGTPTVQVGLSGSSHESAGDMYSSLGGRLVFGGEWGVFELRADRWETPLGYETTGGLAMAIALGRGWSFRGFVGRSDPDPLTLAQPGSGSGGALLGWTFYSTAPTVSERNALYEVLSYSEQTSRVRLSVEPPEGTTQVQLLGDFTLWEPISMTREGDRWITELDVGAGTHHYGFLVDDEWYVPDDAPDVVPDEWGRLSATLVIEGAGS